MMRSDPYEKKKKWRWKLAVLIGLVAAFAGVTVYLQMKNTQADELGASVLTEDKQASKRAAGIQKDLIPGTGDPDMETEDTGDGNAAEEAGVPILNLAEYVSPAMGENAGLLEQRLTLYVCEQQMSAVTGSIVHVMIPESDPEAVAFFVQLEDGAGTLCILTWHPREQVVTASACAYTLDEILAESFESDAPAQRDVSPEEEAAFLEQIQQEAADDAAVPEGETAPEQAAQEGGNGQ